MQGGFGVVGEEDHPWFVAFAPHHKLAAVEIDLVAGEGGKFGYPQAGGEEGFENSRVAQIL